MNTFLKGSALVLLLSFWVIPLAHAKGHDDDTIVTSQDQLQGSDDIVKKDFDTFTKSDFGGRFGERFHAHKAVCSASTSGAVNCDARIVTDMGGTIIPDATPAVGSLSPAQFLKAYSLSGVSGSHTIIAIVDAYDDPNIYADLTNYSQVFGIPTLPQCSGAIAQSAVPCFQKVNQSGQSSPLPTTNTSWAYETSLDVEIAHGVCQDCSILLVESNSPQYTDLLAAIDEATTLGGKIVSNSWGSIEFSSQTSFDSHFNHPGIAYLFSSGDSGYGAQYPASSQYVTSVGGTSLFLNSDGSYNSEVAWSGSGSGCSVYETKPTWQKDASCARRTVADVSADADPNTGAAIYDSFSQSGAGVTGWYQIGGTSLAAPLVAAVYAQAGGVPSTTPANSLPYAATGGLHDVTTGSNGSCGGLYLCTAMGGYDGPTGLGTPNGAAAFTGTATPPPPPPPPPPVGYTGQYWNAGTGPRPSFPNRAPDLTRTDSAINFNWGTGSPDPSINVNHFMARWTKTDTFNAGTYRFTATADDGVRVYVDGSLIINRWNDHGATTFTATKTLSAGSHTIKVEYYEDIGQAVMQFNYGL